MTHGEGSRTAENLPQCQLRRSDREEVTSQEAKPEEIKLAKRARDTSQSMQGNLDKEESFVSSKEFKKRETSCRRVTCALNAPRRGGYLRRDTIVAGTKRATQWNSDAIERLGRQRENENVWWFRCWDEVRRQAPGDQEVLVSDLENYEKGTDSAVCASLQFGAKGRRNTRSFQNSCWTAR